MLSRWRGGLVLLALFLIIARTVAQSACPALVQDALSRAANFCGEVERNQVCYGNLSLQATLRHDAPDLQFEHIGDIMDVLHLQTIKLDPLDETRGVWGLAMMQLQANIPDTLPGQNVSFFIFGDVEIENRSTADQPPMQVFYLRSGVGDAACREAPQSGVLIQTPEGIESVNFNINGVDVQVGSTIMLQAQPAGEFIIRTLEGAAVITLDGQAYPVIAGTQMSMPIDENMQPAGQPSMPTALSEEDLQALPIAPLPREIPPPAPLSDAALMKLQIRLEAGLEPCGVPGLPNCEHALAPEPERVWAAQILPVASETVENIVVPVATRVGNPDPAIVPMPSAGTGTQEVVGSSSLPSVLPDTGGSALPLVGGIIEPVAEVIDNSVVTPLLTETGGIIQSIENTVAPVVDGVLDTPALSDAGITIPSLGEVVQPVVEVIGNPPLPAHVPDTLNTLPPVTTILPPVVPDLVPNLNLPLLGPLGKRKDK